MTIEILYKGSSSLDSIVTHTCIKKYWVDSNNYNQLYFENVYNKDGCGTLIDLDDVAFFVVYSSASPKVDYNSLNLYYDLD